jgi:hypothetical protein
MIVIRKGIINTDIYVSYYDGSEDDEPDCETLEVTICPCENLE